jgi:hypothetical protein
MGEGAAVMARWAVSYIDWSDNDLITEIVQAPNWLCAVFSHSKVTKDEEWREDIRSVAADHNAVKQMFFDCDSMIECVEIPD